AGLDRAEARRAMSPTSGRAAGEEAPGDPPEASEEHALVVEASAEGERLDRFVAARLELSRTRVQKLLEQGHVLVDGRPARKSEALGAGARVSVRVPPPE